MSPQERDRIRRQLQTLEAQAEAMLGMIGMLAETLGMAAPVDEEQDDEPKVFG